MDMKRYLATIITALFFMPLEAKASNEGRDFYGELKFIESIRLNGIAKTQQKLEEIGQFESEFDSKERDLYLLLQAHSKAMQSDYDEARAMLVSLTTQSESIDISSRAYSILAAIENIQGNDVDAFVALDHSLSRLSEISDQIYRLDILQNAVGVYKEAELIEYALELSRRHLTEANRSKKHEPLCHANYELASIEIMAQRTKMAQERLKSARQYCENSEQRLVLLEIEASLAEIAIIEGRYDEAYQVMSELFPKIENYDWDILKSRALINFAEIEFEKGELEKAKDSALESYNLATNSNDKKRILNATAILAKIYSQQGKSEEAIKYYKEYMELNNEHQNKIRQRKLAFQSVKNSKSSSSLGSSK